MAGAFLNFDKVAAASFWVRLIYFLSAAGFGVAIVCGIQYVNYLNYAANQDEKRMWADGRIADTSTSEDDKAKWKERRTEAWKKYAGAWDKMASWHAWMDLAMSFGIAFAVLLLFAGAIWGAPRPNPAAAGGIQNFLSNLREPNITEYEIVQSAVHPTRHGKEAHTFLLDKKTGAVWQMVCQPNSDLVEFQRVRRMGLDGKHADAEQ